MKDDFIKIPKPFVIKNNIIKYDYKSMRDYFDNILKVIGEDMNPTEKVKAFKERISKVNVKLYSQEEYVDIINAIYETIYKKEWYEYRT